MHLVTTVFNAWLYSKNTLRAYCRQGTMSGAKHSRWEMGDKAAICGSSRRMSVAHESYRQPH